MPIRSGAMQRPRGCRCGNTLRQRYDEVGLPCSSTMGSPSPTSTYAISLPRTRRRCFLYGNAAEIILASPTILNLDGRTSTSTFAVLPFDALRWGAAMFFRRVRDQEVGGSHAPKSSCFSESVVLFLRAIRGHKDSVVFL